MSLAFPLQWPEGWQRTPAQRRTNARYKVTPDIAQKELIHSLALLGAHRAAIVISTNVPVRQDGLPYATFRTPDDPGVAVYWETRAHGQRVMACDRWLTVHQNIRAIGLAADGLRAIERAGATQILERAFTAFGALPAAPDIVVERPWWEVLEFPEALLGSLSTAVILARYRELAPKRHPDRTGNNASMVELNRARDQGVAHFSAGASDSQS